MFDGLTPPYATIVADPPWQQPTGGLRRGGSPEVAWNPGRPSVLPYSTMDLAAIKALPVGSLAADDAHLYLWTTNHYLRAAYEVAEGWGFRPSQVLTWCKAPQGLGLGGAFVSTTEFVLFARKGGLGVLARGESTWFNAARGCHSQKPAAFGDLVERVSPGPYVELFARAPRLGWDSWGLGFES